jgi:uncharacterized protein (TIGR00369 family)
MAEYERSGMWANLGARVTELGRGQAVVEATLTPNAHGFPTGKGTIVHGGALAALADMALASAGASVAEEGETVATVDLKVDFMRAGQPGRMIARSSVRRRTRRLCFAEATLEQEDGTVVVEARSVLAFVSQ